MKPLLIYHDMVNFSWNAFLPYLTPWFDIQQFDQHNLPNRSNAVIVMPYFGASTWTIDLQRQGYRVAVDNLFEPKS